MGGATWPYPILTLSASEQRSQRLKLVEMKYIAETEDGSFQVEIERSDEVVVDGKSHWVDLRSINGEALYSIIVDGQSFEVFVDWIEDAYYIMVEGERYVVHVEDERLRTLTKLGSRVQPEHGELTVRAPMPGLVVKLIANPGTQVKVGDGLVILEAMKMENEIRAPRSGIVKSVQVAQGQKVNKDQILAIIE
jgi:biotin carboxyl carrier protein